MKHPKIKLLLLVLSLFLIIKLSCSSLVKVEVIMYGDSNGELVTVANHTTWMSEQNIESVNLWKHCQDEGTDMLNKVRKKRNPPPKARKYRVVLIETRPGGTQKKIVCSDGISPKR